MSWGSSLIGKIGKALTTVGTAFHAPQIIPGGLGAAAQNWASPVNRALNLPFVRVASAYEGNSGGSSSIIPGSQNLGRPGNPGGTYGPFLPATSGQGPGGGGSSGGGNNGGNNGGGGDNGGGNSGPSPEEIYLNQMRDAFSGAKGAYESVLPTYDADLANYTNQAQAGINQAKTTLGQTNADIEKNFGDTLRQALQTDKEIRQRLQGTYSALGTLESSGYQGDLNKQEQALGQNVTNIGTEKSKALTSAQQQYNTYETDALGKINSYKNEIDRAKAGIRQAIASADLNQASSIANYLQQVQSQKAAIEAQLAGFKGNLAALQAQGYDVIGNLKKFNGADFSNIFGGLLASQLGNAAARYVTPSTALPGQGYIAPANRAVGLTEEQKRLLGLV